MASEVDIKSAVELYIMARNEKARLEREHEAAVQQFVDAMEDAKAAMIQYMVANEQKAVRVDAGLVSLVTEKSVYIVDQSAFSDWIKETGNLACMQMRVAKNNVLEYADEHGKLPDGLETSSKYTARVTASR